MLEAWLERENSNSARARASHTSWHMMFLSSLKTKPSKARSQNKTVGTVNKLPPPSS